MSDSETEGREEAVLDELFATIESRKEELPAAAALRSASPLLT